MSKFHEGEIAVQSQIGVRDEAENISNLFIHNFMQPKAQEFVSQRRLAIASTIDKQGRSWASLLTGQPNFIEVISKTEVAITPYCLTGDSLYENLAHNQNLAIFILAIINFKIFPSTVCVNKFLLSPRRVRPLFDTKRIKI